MTFYKILIMNKKLLYIPMNNKREFIKKAQVPNRNIQISNKQSLNYLKNELDK